MASPALLRGEQASAIHDRQVLRDLAKRYSDICRQPRQDELRALWRHHNSLCSTRPLILVMFGMWNPWCAELINEQLACRDALFRDIETWLRLRLFHATLNDDAVFEPWIPVAATRVLPHGSVWGPEVRRVSSMPGGAAQFAPPIKSLQDIERLVTPSHVINEKDTAARVAQVGEALSDIVHIAVDRSPAWTHFRGDIATSLAMLRGHEQIMYDMIERPEWLHRLLSFMRDGILAAHEAAECAGDWRLCAHDNQSMPYAKELPAPSADAHPVKRKDLWGFMAAQEFTLVSPAMHEEFLLNYQIPILREFGLSAYGCCEDLTNKISLLRRIPNLRRIAVTPRANLTRCAEQISDRYVISWRPNPAEMVCCGFDPHSVRRTIRDGLRTAQGCHVDITLKDVETLQGDTSTLRRWVEAARQETELI